MTPIPDTEVITIRPERRLGGLGLSEAWRFRSLLYWLAWRDVRVRYAQMHAGLFWALLQPAALMLVLAVALGFLARVPSDGAPYSVFVVVGVAVWTAFSTMTTSLAGGLVRNAPLMAKVYCSRLAVTLSAAGAPLVDVLALFVAVLAAIIGLGVVPSATVLLAPGFFLWAALLGGGVGLWFATLATRYQDAAAALPILLQIGMFASPVMYPGTLVPVDLRPYYDLNPIAAIIAGARWALYGGPAPSALSLVVAGSTTLILWITALFYFNKVERTLADRL